MTVSDQRLSEVIEFCATNPRGWYRGTMVSALRELQDIRRARPSVVASILRGVCELPGYTSPDDQPDLLQCTTAELELVVRRALGEDV
jgi:hypothetical protein